MACSPSYPDTKGRLTKLEDFSQGFTAHHSDLAAFSSEVSKGCGTQRKEIWKVALTFGTQHAVADLSTFTMKCLQQRGNALIKEDS